MHTVPVLCQGSQCQTVKNTHGCNGIGQIDGAIVTAAFKGQSDVAHSTAIIFHVTEKGGDIVSLEIGLRGIAHNECAGKTVSVQRFFC